ncbi:Uncharacterised protein [Cedecea davisae]|nr:Uncharacterised protein [Cedecea davisae]
MPVSASQHRVSTGAYQKKLHDNFRVNSTLKTQGTNPDRTGIPDEIRNVGSSINRVVNSCEELSRPSYQGTASRQGIAAPLLLLLSQVRLDAIPFSADPLRFPAANASPVPLAETKSTMAADIFRNLKSDGYIVTGDRKQSELISSLVKYWVSDGQLTADESGDAELWLRSEAAGMPMVVARLDNDSSGTTRTRRALVEESDPGTGEHIKEHCAFEEDILNARGENQGKLLLFEAQRAENPFRMIYDDTDGGPSPEARGAANGLNIVAGILTLGIMPLFGGLIANAKRREYYQNKGDEICAERFRRLFIAEVATSLDVDGLTYTQRGGTGKVKPSELFHALPEQERAAFYTRNPRSDIRKEILLELKQGNGAINDNGRKVYLKPTDKTNEFTTYHPDAVNTELLERRVIVDESNMSWRYADSFDSSALNVEISEGKQQVRLHGENYELHQDAVGKYEIVVNKKSGVKEFIPVYMEPLSRTWHLSTHNEHSVFSNKQINTITEIKVKKEKGFYYTRRENNNQSYYGKGNIYVQEQIGDYNRYPWGRYVEMNGELVPVKEMITPGHGSHYEVYDRSFPEKKGHRIEWDGERWLFERKTSAHVSEDLEKIIDPEIVVAKADVGKISAPDHQGLRYDADENRYIKIDNNFVNVYKYEQLYCIRKNNGDNLFIDFKSDEFFLHGNKVTDRFDARKLANIDISALGVHSVPNHKNIYITDNGSLYIKLNGEHYPVEFMGKDRRVVLIGSPNEIRFSCIYGDEDGSVKNIDEYLDQSILTYNGDAGLYIGTDMATEKSQIMKYDKNKNNLVKTHAISIRDINKQLNKIEFKNFDLYIPKKTSRDVYLAAHAAQDINLASQIPDNLELKFYTEKGRPLHGYVDDLQDLVNGKFNAVETKKGGEYIEAYAIIFDHDSQINYARLAVESNKSIIKVKDHGEVTLKNLLRDISSLSDEDKTLHLYMCRSF